MNRKFKGVWIKKEIWLDKHLSIVERCLLAEIDSLSDDEKDENCYASNKYLSELFGVSQPTITRGISKLKSFGYIESCEEKGKRRELRIVTANQIDQTPSQNDQGGNQNDQALLENSVEDRKENKELSPHKKCVDAFFVLHEKRTGKKPMFNGTVGSLLKDMLKTQDAETVIEKLKKYYSDDTLWFTKNGGRSFRSFYNHYNEIDIEKAHSDEAREKMEAWGVLDD